MPIGLFNPDDLDPADTHEYEPGRWLRFTDRAGTAQTGKIFDRGYSLENNHPVYGVICEDNLERGVRQENATLLPVRSQSSP